MISLSILISIFVVVILLCIHRSSATTRGEKVAKSLTTNLKIYQELFGSRRDAQHYLKDVLDDANRIDHYKAGGTGAMGTRLAGGDVAGAALIGAGKVVVDGALGLLGKVSKGLFRSGQQVFTGDGPKSEDQLQWETVIRKELERLLWIRRSVSNLKRAMWIIGGGGCFIVMMVLISEHSN